MGKRLVRTDKNGTQYWVDDRCPKCGGTGYIPCYAYHDGGICYQCGGSGYGQTSWKVYTPEYQAQLEERRAARSQRKAEEFNANLPEHYHSIGLTDAGTAFAVLEKTFGRQDELKAAGARFNGDWWYFDHAAEGWDVVEIDVKELLDIHAAEGKIGWDEDKKGYETKEAVAKILKQRRTEENSKVETSFYGSVGDKFETEVTLEKAFHFESWDFRGNHCVKFGYKMRDSEGHVFVWITGKEPRQLFNQLSDSHAKLQEEEREVEGRKFTLKASVKGHKEREGIKETQVLRCKFI